MQILNIYYLIFFLSNFGKLSTIKQMTKFLTFFLCSLALITFSVNAETPNVSDFMGASAYENLYPYMNNKMRTKLNSGDSPTTTQDAVSTLARTSNTANGRTVVARSGARTPYKSNVGRSANISGNRRLVARSAATPTSSFGRSADLSNSRRVVARSGARVSRVDNSYVYKTTAAAEADAASSTTQTLSTDRCLADYMQCMDGYCEREKTSYNRCYCSSKLAQIDSEYQPAIDELIKQIIELKNKGTYTDAEMNAYWQEKVGQYTGDNSWTKIDTALDINWTNTESRVRGQQAFLTGHEYCSQHLRGCYYMAGNMRDAYVSEIERNCATYKTSLQKLKDTAESVVEYYSE